jgi:hypothetical protein
MSATIGGRICWLLVCIFLASGLVSYAVKGPGNVVALMPRWDGIRVITDQRRRPQQTTWWNLGVGSAIWGALFFVPATKRKWTGFAALAVVISTVQGTEPLRRLRLQQQLATVPVVKTGPYEKLYFHRGVSFIRDGFEAYHPQPTADMLDALKGYGVGSVAVVPYGIYRQGSAEVSLGREADDEAVYVALMNLAHARGVRVLLKPQLWVMPGMFSGSIHLDDPAGRRVWFESYSRFILHWARIAERGHADLFAVGTELEKLSGDEKEWREIVRRVRSVYGGPLTYAANQGPDFENLTWWDAIDYIGLNEYYPLADNLDFSLIVERVEAVHKKFNKPVLLTEVGFASVAGSHREPWSEPRRAVDLEHQVRCYEALLKAFWDKPWFYGMYWWKVGADGRGGTEDRSLTPWKKPAMEVLARYYRAPR